MAILLHIGLKQSTLYEDINEDGSYNTTVLAVFRIRTEL